MNVETLAVTSIIQEYLDASSEAQNISEEIFNLYLIQMEAKFIDLLANAEVN